MKGSGMSDDDVMTEIDDWLDRHRGDATVEGLHEHLRRYCTANGLNLIVTADEIIIEEVLH
jgi:hypothetical protein